MAHDDDDGGGGGGGGDDALHVYTVFVCLFSARQPPLGQGLLIHEVSRSHTTTYHSRYDSSGRAISSSQRPLRDNTQHSQQRDIHFSGGI